MEDLSNELFFEVFDYLDGCDLHKAFSNLNKRFEDIFFSPYLRLKIGINSRQQSDIQYCHTNIIRPNRHKIISLCLLNTLVIDRFFQSMIFDTSFYRLESVVLYDLKSDKLTTLLLRLISVPYLYSLTITINNRQLHDLSHVYRLIFSLPVLKYDKLCIEGPTYLISVKNINSQPSTIKHLNFGHSCSLNDIANIFSYTPHLCHVVCRHLTQSYQRIEKITISLPYLTHISIESCSLRFDELEMFIKKISSQLQMLRLSVSYREDYVDVDRWERLISQHIPHLRNFYFKCREKIDDNFQVTENRALINRFTSPFWFERR
jgi:hypothetical protein